MTRGRKPKPVALRLLDGEGGARTTVVEPVPRPELPECPEGVSADVRAVWDYTVAQLDFMNLARAADRDALYCYCEAVVNHRKASAVLAQSPILIRGTQGGIVRNPALAVQRDAANTMRAFAGEFGLTPVARVRVAGKDEGMADDNPFRGAVGE